ncbi:hypothetical protein [Pseudomonas veronii]|uniref:Uncharacterized protein n=1 Tax=Pseudomonas veronii TaxID=76761 RepID=A0A4P7Y8D8_PSEVE|nr:hypothetical protein [Pseudomonas veronii]QCG67347.1 hypothetical protein E4167_23525 [Pseudomonas veronii]
MRLSVCCLFNNFRMNKHGNDKMQGMQKEVSTNAKTCPHCGVSDPAIGAKELAIGLLTAAAIGFGVYLYFSSGPEQATEQDAKAVAEEKAAADAKCKTDLNCWAEKHLAEASYPCQKGC